MRWLEDAEGILHPQGQSVIISDGYGIALSLWFSWSEWLEIDFSRRVPVLCKCIIKRQFSS